MTFTGIARVIAFYLLLFCIVLLLGPAGPYLSYAVIILASLLFIRLAKIIPRAGNAVPGLIAGTMAITATFGLIIAFGGRTVAGLSNELVAMLLAGVALQVFVAFGEEIAFRGYIFSDLRNLVGLPAALVFSSLGFALLHIHSMLLLGINAVSAVIALISITAAGVLLALFYLRWGLLSAIGFHFTWNFLQYHVFGMGLGGEMPSVMRLTGSGNILLTGGQYGPEASLPGLAVILITLGIVWYSYRKSSKDGRSFSM